MLHLTATWFLWFLIHISSSRFVALPLHAIRLICCSGTHHSPPSRHIGNVSIHPQNESPIIESGFLQPLINLLSFKDNEEVQCHAISTLRNLAASSEKNKQAIVKAGAVQSIKELVLEVPMNVQSEMTACIAVLALSGMCALLL